MAFASPVQLRCGEGGNDRRQFAPNERMNERTTDWPLSQKSGRMNNLIESSYSDKSTRLLLVVCVALCGSQSSMCNLSSIVRTPSSRNVIMVPRVLKGSERHSLDSDTASAATTAILRERRRTVKGEESQCWQSEMVSDRSYNEVFEDPVVHVTENWRLVGVHLLRLIKLFSGTRTGWSGLVWLGPVDQHSVIVL